MASEHRPIQVYDVILYHNLQYSLMGVEGVGIHSSAISDFRSSYRGWTSSGHIHYAVQDGRLVLTSFTRNQPASPMSQAGAGQGPELCGKVPRDSGSGFWIYEGLQHPLPFTGALLLKYELRVLKADPNDQTWMRDTCELIFHEGRLVEEFDRTFQTHETMERFHRNGDIAEGRRLDEFVAKNMTSLRPASPDEAIQ